MHYYPKSPLKVTSKSIDGLSNTSKPKNKHFGVSASKNHPQIMREVYNNQAYKTNLSRLLCKNTL